MSEELYGGEGQHEPGHVAERVRGGEPQTYDSSDSQSMDRALEEVHRRRQELPHLMSEPRLMKSSLVSSQKTRR